MSNALLFFLIPVAILGTTVVLGIGIYSLAKGGGFAKAHSNNLMRYRVIGQGVALLLILAFVWLRQQGAG